MVLWQAYWHNTLNLMNKRVVITGMGVVAPNGVGLDTFKQSLLGGISGIKHHEFLEELNFRCQVAGVPPLSEEEIGEFSQNFRLRKLLSTGILYGCMAAVQAWEDAGLEISQKSDQPLWDSGCVFGAGMTGIEALNFGIPLIDRGDVKQLGSRIVQQTMSSGVSAYINGILGFGNLVTSNSSACATGTESILIAYDRIMAGRAKRMLAGSCEGQSPYIWGGFDSMRVLAKGYNDKPEQASRPMSESASGFVPGAGSGALVLEDMEAAIERGATIYAEVLGGAMNAGGQRAGGSMTAPNTEGVQKCIQAAIHDSGISPNEIDAICGHLTSTMGDPLEIRSWSQVLNRSNGDFPYVNSLKSMIGHCLSASGAIENIAAILQLRDGFFHPSINCEDLHPEIEKYLSPEKVPSELLVDTGFNTVAKASFGFGDVNTCIVFKKWNTDNN